jgi:hypothetical protein
MNKHTVSAPDMRTIERIVDHAPLSEISNVINLHKTYKKNSPPGTSCLALYAVYLYGYISGVRSERKRRRCGRGDRID